MRWRGRARGVGGRWKKAQGSAMGLIGCLLPPAWLALEIQALRGLAGSMQQHCVWMHVSVEPGYTEKMIGYPDE